MLMIVFCMFPDLLKAQTVSVHLTSDPGNPSQTVKRTAEQNLSILLGEINSACAEERELNVQSIPMTDMGRKALTTLWSNIHFSTTSAEVRDRLWVFQKSGAMQVNHVPLILSDSSPVNSERQDAVVEFDLSGRISDFRFTFESGVFESAENKSEVADLEEQVIIWKFMDQLATAYYEKNIDFLNKIYSDDALIITGSIQRVQSKEFGMHEIVKYSRQTKTQYLRNLQKSFARNKWIKVDFKPIDDPYANGGKSRFITHRKGRDGRNYYGVRVHQSWRSGNGYHDEGYLFLLWEFPENDDPVIHVRTWQPEQLNGKKIDLNEIFSEVDFVEF